MSAAEHERAARVDDERAVAHTSQYDENAANLSVDCGEFCFSTWSNPTEQHAMAARRHRALAKKHRAASKTLRDAESTECKDIPERDRDISPFFHGGDILGVDRSETSRADGPVTFRVHFRTIEGVDVERMQRLVDCHLARSAARGHEAPEMSYCPLVPPGVEVTVEAAPTGIDVILTVDPPSHYEVEHRLQQLVSESEAADAVE